MAQSSENQTYIPARLRKPAKDAKDQRWMLIWWVQSVKDGKLVRRRQGFDLNTIDNKRDREKRALQLITDINKLLKKGFVWDPDKLLQQRQKRKPATGTNMLRMRPLLEACDQFVATRTDRAYGTLAGYQLLRKHLQEWLEQEDALSLIVAYFDKEQAAAFCQWQSQRVSTRTGRPIGRKSYNNYLVNLATFCNWLVKQGILKRKEHPLEDIQKKKEGKSESHRPYSNEQLRAILDAVATKGDQPFLLYLKFLYYTFARPRSEVRMLRAGDIREQTIYIRPELDKNRLGRHVDIPPDLEAAIQEAGLRQLPADTFLFGLGGPASKPVNKRYYYKKLQAILRGLGIYGQGYDLYGFKHTGNINYYLATKDVYAVMRQNGHTSLSMTERYLRGLGVLRDQKTLSQFPTMGG